MSADDILSLCRQRAREKTLYLPHAVKQLFRPDRMITADDVQKTIENGRVIEDYPDDARGHSCLILGTAPDGRKLHVVCAPKHDYLAIITAYPPSALDWDADYETRRKK